MQPRTELDRDKLQQFLGQVSGSLTAGINCAVTAVGDQLGLYQALHGLRAATSAELAAHTGLSERWVREWLRHQACLRQVDYDADSDRFHLSPEAVAVLVDDGHPSYMMGGFHSVVATFPSVGNLAQSFHTGIGRSYDDHGEGCACGIERMSAYANRVALFEKVLPLLEGGVAQFERGIRVADVGCGGGVATIAMAERYPNSSFIGYDTSEHALERARGRLATLDLPNIRFVNPLQEAMPASPTFDLVTTFDVVHDTTHPAQLIGAIHGALADDGSWLCADIRSFPAFADNLAKNPMAGLMYGFSLMVCMSSGLSTPDGAGLGTLGFNEVVARGMTSAAGFTRFRRLDYDNPMNNYYEIRK
jgi:2-polyprenyl-3-methyl-5-hydroxy-6-metoxy-1,4-benzoquinol methylase